MGPVPFKKGGIGIADGAQLGLHVQVKQVAPSSNGACKLAAHQAAPDNSDEDVADAAPATGKKSKDAETLALIEKLLAKSGRSDALREELEEYKADITNGEFDARDHQYVRALHKRLAK